MTNYPRDEDGAVLAHLAKAGVDMTQPLLIEFAVAAPDEASATAIGNALNEAGYAAQVEYDEREPDEDGNIDPHDDEFVPSWSVYANVTMIPDHQEIVRVQSDLDRIASPLGGKSDGWGTMI